MILLSHVVEVMRSLSNLIKSGFVAFSDTEKIIIDANKSKILQEISERNVIKNQELCQSDEVNESNNELDEIVATTEQIHETADEIYQEAQNAAERILEDARAEALLLKEDATNDGKAEGYKLGQMQAQSELQARMQELEQQYQQKLMNLENQYEQQIDSVEPQIVKVVCNMLENITGVLLDDYHDVLLYMINSAMRNLDSAKNIIIKVSEEEFESIKEQKHLLYGANNPSVSMELFADSKLNLNQCIIETENGIINCSLDEQLRQLTKSLTLLSQM